LPFKVATSGPYMSSHCAVPYEVVDEEVFKKFLRRASNLLIEGSGFVRSFNFAMVEQFFIFIYGGHKRVVSNGSTRISGLWNGCVMIVEASVILDKLHDGSIRAVYAKGCLDSSIHRDLALFLHGGHGEDVCKGFWVVPHTAKILEVTNLGRDLGTTVCVNLEDASTLTYVGKEMVVVENFHHRLTVKEDRMRWDKVVPGLGKSELRDQCIVVRVRVTKMHLWKRL